MKQLILEMPTMYADHHVLKVREALEGLKGIEDAYASSAWTKLMISYQEETIKPEEIEKALTTAGYPPGEGATPILVKASSDLKRDPQWEKLGSRVTETNQIDLEISGQSRR
ncbi:MAG: heavy-metal-associated domain-containing protein [Anaerolineales bacterium]|nr:heavy-metal-associated domain-containing protein [Anaerolineales bacterium]